MLDSVAPVWSFRRRATPAYPRNRAKFLWHVKCILCEAAFHTFCRTEVRRSLCRRKIMLYWALVFFLIALVAAPFGFFGIAAGAASIARILFFVFVVLFLVSLLTGMRPRGTI
jgi:uncharacterized membrane protein YtjA (UPF0391 family)